MSRPKVAAIYVIASRYDDVLKLAFPAGELIGEILMPVHPYDRAALGREGPARPLPVAAPGPGTAAPVDENASASSGWKAAWLVSAWPRRCAERYRPILRSNDQATTFVKAAAMLLAEKPVTAAPKRRMLFKRNRV